MRHSRVDIDDRKEDLLELLEADKVWARHFWEKLDRSWVYHECALEGVVITGEELEQSLALTLPVPETSKMQFLADIRRQQDAFDVVKEEAQNPKAKLNLALAKKLFETLTGGEQGRGVMELRKDMPLHRTYFHDIQQPAKIVPELTKVFEYVASPEWAALPPLQQATMFHHKFMSVFPFTDLSGKVGRLMMNIVLMRAGYLPAVIHGIDRQRYYESLKQQPRALQVVITEAIEHATEHGFKFFAQRPAAPAPTKARKAG
jgi:Fic family protein